MDLWLSALVGAMLLAGAFVFNSFRKKTAAPKCRYLTVVLCVLSALCFFYCASALLLAAGID